MLKLLSYEIEKKKRKKKEKNKWIKLLAITVDYKVKM